MIHDLENLRKFWDFYFMKLTNRDRMEIRLVNVGDVKCFDLFKEFCENEKLYYQKNCQMFLNSNQFPILMKFFRYKDGFIIKNSKVCYSLNARQFKDGLCGGGYKFIKRCHVITFDIEQTNHNNLTEFTNDLLTEYTKSLIDILRRHNLHNPFIIFSGAGVHLLYKIEPTEITESRKRWYKEFINEISNKYKTNLFHFDALKDFTRVFGLPGTLNVKRQQRVRILECSTYVNNFKLRSKQKKKSKNKGLPYVLTDIKIEEEPLVKFMMYYDHIALQEGGQLSRNQYLEMQLACLLRDNDIDPEDIPEIIDQINDNLNKRIQVSSNYVEGKYFNKFVVNKWSQVCCGCKIYLE